MSLEAGPIGAQEEFMKKQRVLLNGIALFTAFLVCASALNAVPRQDGELFPQLKPYKTGYFEVSKKHKLFYQLGGNPKGTPVMVIHGGPGVGCFPGNFRYFSPEKYHIILHDQRGSGQSIPYGEIEDNTTQHLVQDIEKLRKHLGLGKVVLFGGSWGSTLILAYAETYPQSVKAMIMRGIFTATKTEIDHFYNGGTALFFPENYDKLLKELDHPNKKNIAAQLLKKIQSEDPNKRKKYARLWAFYELKIAYLEISDATVKGYFKIWDPTSFAILENHYMANRCFLKEGQLLDNTHKIAHIPAVIINGRYDLICPPITAYKLHKKLPKSQLFIIEKAGHASTEPETLKQLVLAAKRFE